MTISLIPLSIGILSLCVVSNSSYSVFRKKFVACDKEKVSISCSGFGEVVVFESANYGRTDSDQCGGYTTTTDCVDYLTVTTLNELCLGKTACHFQVDAPTMKSWVCPLTTKYLEATYSCVPKSHLYDVCGKAPINRLPAYVVSPNYPQFYQSGTSCVLSLRDFLEDGVSVRVLDVDMELDDAAGCLDYLVVREQDNPRQKYLYCGLLETNLRQQEFTLRRPQFVFESDDQTPYRGFLAVIEKGDFKEQRGARPVNRDVPALNPFPGPDKGHLVRSLAGREQAALVSDRRNNKAVATLDNIFYFVIVTATGVSLIVLLKIYIRLCHRKHKKGRLTHLY